ncbi:Multidrug resistance protein D [Bienertia sinuspersici]
MMHEQPMNIDLIEKEKMVAKAYKEAHSNYIEWLKDGHECTRLFFNSIKKRQISNKIPVIRNLKGDWVENRDGVVQAFVNFYVYSYGLEADEHGKIKDMVGFQDGDLPFKYLRVPISSKKLKAKNFSWVIAKKQDNLCVSWVHSVYLKEKDWWSYKPSRAASWVKDDITQQQPNIVRSLQYKVGVAYKKLTGEGQKIPWSYEVWNRYAVPKHRFVAWLALKNRLMTKAGLSKFRVQMDCSCSICGAAGGDSRPPYGGLCLCPAMHNRALMRLGIKAQIRGIVQMMEWTRRRYKGSKFKKKVILDIWLAILYSVRQNRNMAVWSGKV